MKRFVLVGVYLVVMSFVFAGHEQPEDLAVAIEQAVGLAAKGDVGAATRAINLEARTQKSAKEVNAQIDKFKEAYEKLSGMGESDGVERVSLVYTGDSFFRLRLVDKRADGVVLWTFIGYKFKGRWYCKGLTFNGGDDLMSIMKQELDAADARASHG